MRLYSCLHPSWQQHFVAPCVQQAPPLTAPLAHPLWLQCFFMTPCAGQTPPHNGSICAALVAATFLCGAMRDANSASPQLNDKLDARDLMLLPSTFLAVNGTIFQMPKASSRSRKTRPCKIFLGSVDSRSREGAQYDASRANGGYWTCQAGLSWEGVGGRFGGLEWGGGDGDVVAILVA